MTTNRAWQNPRRRHVAQGIAALLAAVLTTTAGAQDDPAVRPAPRFGAGARVEQRRPVEQARGQRQPGDARPGDGVGREMIERLAETREVLARMKDENPAEFQRLIELRDVDRMQFMREVRELLASRAEGADVPAAAPRPPAEEQRAVTLSQTYHGTRDAAEKERIRQELRRADEEAFDGRLAQQKARLQEMERELERIRQSIAQRETNRDVICENRVTELTRDPALRWDR